MRRKRRERRKRRKKKGSDFDPGWLYLAFPFTGRRHNVFLLLLLQNGLLIARGLYGEGIFTICT